MIASGSIRSSSKAGAFGFTAAFESRGEILAAGHRLAVQAVGSREHVEVGVDEVGGDHPARIVALLVHPDGAVAAVIDHQEGEVAQALRGGGGDLLAVHQEIAVAAPGDDFAAGVQNCGRDACRDAIAHRTALRRELGAEAAIAVETVQPLREIPGAAGDDGVLGQRILQIADRMSEVEAARHLRRLRERLVGGAHFRAVRGPGRVRDRLQRGERGGEFRHAGVDPEIGLIDLADLVDPRMRVDQKLARLGQGEERIALGDGLAELGAGHQQQIGLPDRIGEGRVDAEPRPRRRSSGGGCRTDPGGETRRRRGGRWPRRRPANRHRRVRSSRCRRPARSDVPPAPACRAAGPWRPDAGLACSSS